MNDASAFEQATAWIRAADGMLITAGAGMGVDSGLLDFRGPEGFWRAYPALRHHGSSFEEMANPEGFVRHPRLAWGFYGHRAGALSRDAAARRLPRASAMGAAHEVGRVRLHQQCRWTISARGILWRAHRRMSRRDRCAAMHRRLYEHDLARRRLRADRRRKPLRIRQRDADVPALRASRAAEHPHVRRLIGSTIARNNRPKGWQRG